MTNIAGQPKRTFSPEEDAVLTAERGRLTAEEIGARLDRSPDAIRRRWRILGLAVARPGAAGPKRAARPVQAPRPCATGDDAALIADFLARRSVTVLPSGPAAGLTALERQFGAVKPPGTSWIEQAKRGRKARAA